MACKIRPWEWIALYIITGALDFIQFFIIELILVWYFGLGAAINEILDPVVGVILTAYFIIRKVSLFKHPSRFASLLGIVILEEATGGVAQLWIADVWYMHRSIKKEDAEIQAAQAIASQGDEDVPVNKYSEIRYPTKKTKPLNVNGVRSPIQPIIGTLENNPE